MATLFLAKYRILVLSSAVVLAAVGCGEKAKVETASFNETKAECAATAVPNSYVVQWKDGTVSVARGWTRDEFENEIFEPYKDDIRWAEQDQVVSAKPAAAKISTQASNDDSWGQLKTSAATAWSRGVLGDGITVAVIDSGVDITHPQLRSRLAVNSKEIPGNGIDDDENGFVDDVHGWDFDEDQPIVSDSAGHGTHVAGIILAEHGASAVQGIAPMAKLLPLDFMNADGQGNIGDAILAIQYAADQGARVINASWGGAPCSQTLSRTIADLETRGILFIAAAGNSGVDLEQLPEYPAAFVIPNQITVGASTARDYTAGFSNFSYRLVHLFAPGASILSTYPGNRVASLSGTSMAAPFVAGAAALLMSAHPTASVSQIRSALLDSVDAGPFAATTRGRLNIPRALDSIR